LTNVVVFLPIATMSSIVGRFMKELALAASFSTIFSLLFSFTLTPMLASLMISKKQKERKLTTKIDAFYKKWDDFYQRLLTITLKNKIRAITVVIASFALFVIASLYYGPKVGFDFVPQMDNGQVAITVELPEEYNLKETARLLETIEERIRKYPQVKNIVTELGRITDINAGTNTARMDVNLLSADEREEKLSDLMNQFVYDLSDIPNARLITINYKGGAGQQGSPIQFFLLGQEMHELEKYKDQIIESIKDVPGLINLDQSSRQGKPEITVTPKRTVLAESGISVQEIALTVRAAIQGIAASKYRE